MKHCANQTPFRLREGLEAETGALPLPAHFQFLLRAEGERS
jgi:hypothetical protein